jgi:hypothetical protein
MANFTYTQRIDLAALQVHLRGRNGGVMRDMLRRGLLVETQAKRNLGGGEGFPKRVDTGRLRASITTQVVESGGQLRVTVGTNVRYARWVHDGTGLYGPNHRYITPKRRRRMKFKTKTSGGRYVYARRVQGMRPNPFLVSALSAARG